MNEGYRGRVGVATAVILIAVVLGCIFIWLFPEFDKRVVDFTYQEVLAESYGEERQLTVRLNLSDGMSITEAVQVADALFEDCLGSFAYSHEVVSANMSGQEMWNVELAWNGDHWFRAMINPTNMTILYDRCRCK